MRKKLCIALILLLVMGTVQIFAQRPVNIKLASLVPENTPWGIALNRMAAEWARATNGLVTMQIYHNATAGGEADVLRKLRQNQLQAAILSTIGMSSITQEMMTMSAPFLIRTDDELDMVLANLKEDLEKMINSKGFYTLAWARAGWVKIFSKAPVFVPADLKRQKMGTAPEQLELMQAFKAMGYQMVPVDMPDILIALSGGMVDAVYQSPIAVAGFQIFGIAKNVLDLNLAPFMGGLIMNQTAWRTIPDKFKPQLIEITKKIEKEMDTSIIKLEAEAVGTMKNYGLVINQPTAAQAQMWYDDTDKAIPGLLGSTFDRNLYNRIAALLKDYRSKH